MTSGGISGTSGKTRFQLGPWTLIALVTLPVVLVNATSDLIEMQRSGLRVHPVEPFIWEVSSAAILLLLAPLVGWAGRRWPLQGAGLPLALLIHAGLTVPFSLVHVGTMVPLREIAYAVAGWEYDFFSGGLWMTLIYEWRKDHITYAIFAGAYSLYTWWQARETAPAPVATGPQRIEVRTSARTIFLMPGEILYLESAGNYVTLHTAAGSHLVRATLSDWARRLSDAAPSGTDRDTSGHIGTVSAPPFGLRAHPSLPHRQPPAYPPDAPHTVRRFRADPLGRHRPDRQPEISRGAGVNRL